MKKITFLRSLLAILLLAVSTGYAWADVTDVLTVSTFGASGTTYKSFSGKTSNSDAVYAAQMAGGNNSIQIRSNNSNSGIITTTSGGKVKSITITWNSNTTTSRKLNVYGSSTAYSTPADLYDNSKYGTQLGSISYSTTPQSLTINGDYEYIGLRSASGAMYIDKIEIVWEEAGSATPTVSKPTFTPDGGIYYGAQTVSIAAEEGATIYYTTDGEDPTTASDVYSAPFEVATTTTVKAIAVLDEQESSVASATYTIAPSYNNIAELVAGGAVDAMTLAGTVTVTAQSGSYMFVTDATGSMCIFGSGYGTFENGDTFTGIKGEYKLYNGLPEIAGATLPTAGEGTAVEPVVMTIDEILALDNVNISRYIKVEGVNISGVDGKNATVTDANGDEIPLYNQLGLSEITEGENLTIVGIVGYFNKFQIQPLEITTATGETIVADPVFSHEAGEVVFGTEVTLTAAEGAVITYSVNDGPTQTSEGNTATVVIDRPTVEIYAFASIGEVLSEGVTYTYNATLPITFSHPEGGVLPGTVVTIETLPGAILLGTITVNGVGTDFEAANTYEVTINEATEIYVMASISSVTAEATVNYTIEEVVESGFVALTSLSELNETDTYYMAVDFEGKYMIAGNISKTTGGYFYYDEQDALKEGAAKFKFAQTAEGYSIYMTDDTYSGYLQQNGTSNNFKVTETSYSWTVAYVDGYFNIGTTDDTRLIAYNGILDSERISSYKVSTLTGAQGNNYSSNIILFKYVEGVSYEENIVCGAMYYMKPSEEWLAAANGYAARFVNKNVDTELTIAGELLDNGFVAFYIPAVTRASSDYTHVTFSYVDGEGNTVAQTAEQTYPGYGYAFDVAGDNWIDISTSIDGVEVAGGIAYANGVVTAEGAIEVYNVGGAIVARGNDNVDLRALNAGVYIVRNGNQVRKVVR